MSSMLMSQQYTFQKASLKRKIQKTKLAEENLTRGLLEPNSVFALGAMVQYFLIQCLSSLYRP